MMTATPNPACLPVTCDGSKLKTDILQSNETKLCQSLSREAMQTVSVAGCLHGFWQSACAVQSQAPPTPAMISGVKRHLWKAKSLNPQSSSMNKDMDMETRK
ncbi:hypothetical protein [Hoeflea sp.]|uniref:hypothetical protein n=1 Tax=Hoeflea sp. TaxID=1940281 RepID=UPI003A8FAD0D